jgi:acylphosphatase
MAITQTRIVRIVVEGAVQGVGYRVFVSREAGRLQLDGWVRNRRDGSVEAMVTGRPDAVDLIIEWARKGPRSAVVTAVDVFAGEGTFYSFDAWPTE